VPLCSPLAHAPRRVNCEDFHYPHAGLRPATDEPVSDDLRDSPPAGRNFSKVHDCSRKSSPSFLPHLAFPFRPIPSLLFRSSYLFLDLRSVFPGFFITISGPPRPGFQGPGLDRFLDHQVSSLPLSDLLLERGPSSTLYQVTRSLRRLILQRKISSCRL